MKTGEIADKLFHYLWQVLYDPAKASLDVESLPQEFNDLGKGMVFFSAMLDELRLFASELAKGNLGVKTPSPANELVAPLKSLHANLRHLTWQTQRVALGDYKQRVDFMGDFANAFNAMIRQLDEQHVDLMNKIEESRQKTLALEQSVSLFEAITMNVPQWIIVVDPDSDEELFINQTASNILKPNEALFLDLRAWLKNQVAIAAKGLEPTKPVQLTTKLTVNAKTWFLSVWLHPLTWRKHNAVAFIINDRSEEHEYLQELENAANKDALTRVTSRHYGMKTLHEWVTGNQEFCLCFVDMDNLKYVNDTFGHNAGDSYIISVANLLSSFSVDALVSRLGGDEFMVLQKDWNQEHALARLKELRDELATQPVTPENSYVRSISYGVIHVPTDNTTPVGELLSIADERMYRFKRSHKKQRQHPV